MRLSAFLALPLALAAALGTAHADAPSSDPQAARFNALINPLINEIRDVAPEMRGAIMSTLDIAFPALSKGIARSTAMVHFERGNGVERMWRVEVSADEIRATKITSAKKVGRQGATESLVERRIGVERKDGEITKVSAEVRYNPRGAEGKSFHAASSVSRTPFGSTIENQRYRRHIADGKAHLTPIKRLQLRNGRR